MLQDLILYSLGYLAVGYLAANSLVRVVLGRSCQLWSWCLTSALGLASLAYIFRLPLERFYAGAAVPYVAAVAVAVPLFVSASLLIARRRSPQS